MAPPFFPAHRSSIHLTNHHHFYQLSSLILAKQRVLHSEGNNSSFKKQRQRLMAKCKYPIKCKDATSFTPAEAKRHSNTTSAQISVERNTPWGRRPPHLPPAGKIDGEISEIDTKSIRQKRVSKTSNASEEAKSSIISASEEGASRAAQQQAGGPVQQKPDSQTDWPRDGNTAQLRATLHQNNQWERATQNQNKTARLLSQSKRLKQPAETAHPADATDSHHKQHRKKGAMENAKRKFKFRKIVKQERTKTPEKLDKLEASGDANLKITPRRSLSDSAKSVRRILTYESPEKTINPSASPKFVMSTNRGRSPGTPGSRGSSGRGRSPGASGGPSQREGAAQALTPEQRQQRARQVAYWREEILKKSPCREMRFSNELEQMAVDTMVDKYSDPDVYVGGASEAYIEPEFGGREGARDRQKAMTDTAHKRYILLSGGCRVSDVMATLHPFLYRRFQEHANNQGRPSYDIPRLEGAALDRAQFICEAFRHEWQQNVTVNARSGVAPPLSMPTAMKLALTEGTTEERMAACQRLLDECDNNKRRAESAEAYKHRMVKAEREVVELRQRAASAPPRVEAGKVYVDNKSGEDVLCIPVGQVNRFLMTTGQGWEITRRAKSARRVTLVEPEATTTTRTAAAVSKAPPPSQPMEEDVIDLHPGEQETTEGWWPA